MKRGYYQFRSMNALIVIDNCNRNIYNPAV